MLIVKPLSWQSPAGGSRKRSAHASVPDRRRTRGQSWVLLVSILQPLGPFSVWQLTVTCVIAASLRLESARCRSRMPFFFGSTLVAFTAVAAVVPGGGARTSSAPSAFFGSVAGVAASFVAP